MWILKRRLEPRDKMKLDGQFRLQGGEKRDKNEREESKENGWWRKN